MLAHNLAAQRQTDTRSFVFGGEKRYEDALLHVFEDARSVVPYSDEYPASSVEKGNQVDAGPVASVQRVHGIAQKIDEHLLDEVGVGRDLERLGIDFSAQRDAFFSRIPVA